MIAFRFNCAISAWRRVLRAPLLGALSLLAVTACTIEHDYLWEEYEIEEPRITTRGALENGGPVSTINSQTMVGRYFIGQLGIHEYYGTLTQFSESLVVQLAGELEKRGVKVEGSAAKTLRVRVTHISIERGVWVIRAHMQIEVEAGNGYKIEKLIGNSTPGSVPRAVNGAVALAVIDILNDPKIVEYLSGRVPEAS